MTDITARLAEAIHVDDLAQLIRCVDGDNSLGAAQLAEEIHDWIAHKLAAYESERVGWQPIETAPRQMKVLVGYRNSHGHWRNVTAIYYPDGSLPTEATTDDGEDEFAPAGWYETSETHEHIYLTDVPPTHWQPLPAAPVQP